MTMQERNFKNASIIDLTRCFEASDRQRAVSRKTAAMLAAAGMDIPERRWFVVTVDFAMDRKVAETLVKANVEVWVPHIEVVSTRRRKGPKRAKETRFARAMPGYVFARIAAIEQSWAGVLSIKGVRGILSSGGRPVAVRDEAIVFLKRYLDENEEARKLVLQGYTLGEIVIIKDGPFRSFEGKVEAIDGERERVSLEVFLFGQGTKVHLELAQIGKL